MEQTLGVTLPAGPLTGETVDGLAEKYFALNPSDPTGVCATVRLQMEQQVVLSRQAVTAELGIENNTADPITELGVNVIIYDLAGNDVTSRFQVRPPALSNISATDGTGQLGAQTTGTVRWVIVPTDEASPTGPTQYRVGALLTYVQGGRRLTIPIQPIEVTVLPNPQLTLNYFHQRDVFSDDPFTDVVEASQPYTLAVLVQNDGAGDAKNLTITSAQPKIVDNEKGLLVDFQIVATEVAGQELSPSLTTDFGTVKAGESAIGQWLLTSSLQGALCRLRRNVRAHRRPRRSAIVDHQEREHPRVDPHGGRR